jgi:putative membrane protein
MEILVNWLISSLSILCAAYIIPGVHITDFFTAFVLAIVLGVINAIVKPFLIIFTLPINILTLGLFTLVINAILILLAAKIVPGFKVDGFWWALLFSLTLSLISSFLGNVVKHK